MTFTPTLLEKRVLKGFSLAPYMEPFMVFKETT